MLTQENIKDTLSKSFNSNFGIRLVKPLVFQLLLPYYHEDGDMIDIYLQLIGDKIILTDFGQTLMRLSYYTEIDSDTRKNVFETILSSYNIIFDEGKIILNIENIELLFTYLMEFIAVVTKVSDISYLKQERAKSMFYEYFDYFMINDLSKKLGVKITKDYSPEFDEKNEYVSPYAILKPSVPPILYFPILNDDKCKDTAMTLLYYKTKNFQNNSIGVFHDLKEISSKNIGKVMDLLDRPLSSFDGNRERLISYARQLIL